MPKVIEGVKVDDKMVGGFDGLKYSYHDVFDTIKFPGMAEQSYLESRREGPSDEPLLEPAKWILGLYNIGIMNSLDILHFGHGKHINEFVKKMLSWVHGEVLWMDRLVPINVDIIATITGIPTDGENIEQYLEDKIKAKSISDEIKPKYGMERGNRGIRISDINDHVTRFATRLLGFKLMHKCRKEEVLT
jgi:hypothetical protein